ncbi:MAG: anti-sigma factor antagonist [Chitinivibrionales bacterium]|nr:anti-sigma factor antagonist [Chitinivibrionales bacterium]
MHSMNAKIIYISDWCSEPFFLRSLPMALTIHVTKHKEVPLIQLQGRIVDLDVKKFSQKMEKIYSKKPLKIVIDLSKANFIDSHGLGVLVYYHTLQGQDNHQLLVLNTNQTDTSYLHRLFDLTNLYKVIPVIASLDYV